jgi:hypothetical protein
MRYSLLILAVVCLTLTGCGKRNFREVSLPVSNVRWTDDFEVIKAEADKGDPTAMYMLSTTKGHIAGLTQEQQNQYLFQAAELDYVQAQLDLFNAYKRGERGFEKSSEGAIYMAKRLACSPGGASYSAGYLAILYGNLDNDYVSAEEQALVQPNLPLAYAHASMVPIKIFGTRIEQEKLEKMMTEDQIKEGEKILEQFRFGKKCPYQLVAAKSQP